MIKLFAKRHLGRKAAACVASVALVSTAGCAGVIESDAARARADDFDAALRQACASGEIVPATSLIPEQWDRMLVVGPGTYGYMVNNMLGFEYTNENSFYGSSVSGFLLHGDRKIVEFTYQYVSDNPPVEMPAPGYVFEADSLHVTPKSETPESMQRWLEHRNFDCILLSSDDEEAYSH